MVAASPPAPVFGVPGVTTVLVVPVAAVVTTGVATGVVTFVVVAVTTFVLAVEVPTTGVTTVAVVVLVVVLVCANARLAPLNRSAAATTVVAPNFAVCM